MQDEQNPGEIQGKGHSLNANEFEHTDTKPGEPENDEEENDKTIENEVDDCEEEEEVEKKDEEKEM